MTTVTLAAAQMECGWDRTANLDVAESLVRQAAAKGGQVILLPELFETPYFCKDHSYEFFDLATPVVTSPAVLRLRRSRASSAWCCRSRSSSAPATSISIPW